MISFQNTNYRTRVILLPEFGNVLVSTSILNTKLLNKSGSYVSEEACMIDEKVFYFVEECEIALPDVDFKKLLVTQVT